MTVWMKKLLWGAFGAAIAIFPTILMAHYNGPDSGHAGAPVTDDPNSCAQGAGGMCHSTPGGTGGPVNHYGGSVSATFSTGSTYIPGGAPVTITVTATDPVNTHFGFQMTARVSSTASTKSPQQAGTFSTSSPNIIVLCNDDNLRPSSGSCSPSFPYEYIEHFFETYDLVYTTSQSYQFTWTPPAMSVGNVTFYVAGNVVNYDNAADAQDHVYTANYTLTPAAALPPPTIATGGVLNAASFAKTSAGLGSPVSPGSLVAIFGINLGSAQASATGSTFPTTLGGVSVTFNNVSAPLSAVLPNGPYPSINAQVPFEVAGSGSVPVVVTVNGVPSPAETTQMIAQAPGIFTIPSGVGNAVVVNLSDGSIAAPAGSIGNLNCHPIARGQTAYLYATGLGAMTPSVPDGTDGGAAAGSIHNANALPTILVDGIPVTPVFAGQAPVYPGVYQVNFAIPQGAHTGNAINVQIQSADGAVTSAAGISTIAIQ
jgi:uncharacterized protein (TIGR03437 family)